MQVLEGPGWRLAVEPSRDPWPVLIGGEGWAAELRMEEAAGLRSAVASLRHQLGVLADQLMAEETITLELEMPLAAGSLWVELEGRPQLWQLRFVLSPGAAQRGLEGAWSGEASGAIAAALEQWPELTG